MFLPFFPHPSPLDQPFILPSFFQRHPFRFFSIFSFLSFRSLLFFSSLHFNGMFRVLPSFLVFFFLIVAVVVCTFLRYTRERSCRSHSRCTRVSFSTGCRRESQVRTFPGKKYPIFPCRSKRAAKRGEE